MLNKNQIFEKLNELKLDKERFIVLSGASLVLHGVKDFTSDIDIAVSRDYHDELLNIFDCKLNLVIDGNEIYYLDDGEVEFSCRNYESDYVLIDGVKVQTLDSIINFKKSLGREKDFKDIEIIKAFQNKQNN